MPRFVLLVLVIGLSVYALADCLQTPNPKALPKLVWLAIIVLIPVIGPLLWILFGRTNGRGWDAAMTMCLRPMTIQVSCAIFRLSDSYCLQARIRMQALDENVHHKVVEENRGVARKCYVSRFFATPTRSCPGV